MFEDQPFELIRNILTNPYYTFFAIIVAWIIIYFILRISRLKQSNWPYLDFIWIFVGIIGVIILVDENRRMFKVEELERTEKWIKDDLDYLILFTESPNNCPQYNFNPETLEESVFKQRQKEADLICEWLSLVTEKLKNSKKYDYSTIKKLPYLSIPNRDEKWMYTKVINQVDKINSLIISREQLKELVADDFWQGFKYSFGILLLVIAFGFRLSSTTNKIINSKKNA